MLGTAIPSTYMLDHATVLTPEYLLNSVQQAMLKSFVLQDIAQDSKSSGNELDRRFEILKDACEMNSSLLGEVQRLKASLGQ